MHTGHKERLRQKAMRNISSLEPHEIIELILNFSIIRKNTNPLAHQLLNEFGSIANVIDTDFSKLIEVEGLGESSAMLLKLIPALGNAYANSRCKTYSTITCPLEAYDYFRTIFKTDNKQSLYALCLDKYDRIISVINLGHTKIDNLDFDVKNTIQVIINNKPARVYIAQNRIDDEQFPTNLELEILSKIEKHLKIFGTVLQDYIVQKDGEFCSYKSIGLI